MKSRRLFFYFTSLISIIFLLFFIISCSRKDDNSLSGQDKEKSSGVISLLDSYGVGDVPLYPRAAYDKELDQQFGEFRNQLNIPDEYIDVLFTVRVTGNPAAEVLEYYGKTFTELGWEKSVDMTGSGGGLFTWEKLSNRDTVISYIVASGNINHGGQDKTVLVTGYIIPEDEKGKDEDLYADTTKEGNEIGPGNVYFSNPTTPGGEGLLDTKPVSMGIEEWSLWLQEGSSDKEVAENETNKVYLVEDANMGRVVEFYRESDTMDGGASGIYRKLDIDLARFSELRIWLVGKISKEEGGNIANINYDKYFPEGAVQVRLKYLTENNNEKEWFHGFFYSNINYSDKLNFNLVTKDRWFWYISPNLLELDNKPAIIKEIQVYGFGWQFKGQVSEIEILGN